MCLALVLFVAAGGAYAGSVDLKGDFVQGGLVRGQTAPDARILLGSRKIRVSPQGIFIVGFTRDAPASETLTAKFADGTETRQVLKIRKRTYDIQRINGLPPKMVTPPKAVLKRIKRENGLIRGARMVDRPEIYFDSGWIWPAKGRISGVYGSQRVLNGKPKRPHFGVDIAAPVGVKVIAPADGVVVLAELNLYYTGGTIILDHGHGLSSAFLHMSSLSVKKGRKVRQGDLLGAIGKTGRATGAHLDWRINWFDRRLDPALLAPKRADLTN
ncbi:MAG: M23 family metallopeptidase [Alphaproteobacteria bacterium]|nr:M23 family metallopeptidase [Alphaproteobacteria bacterium]